MENVIFDPVFSQIVCKWEPILAHCPLFLDIAPEEWPGLFSCLGARLHRYDRGEMPLVEGQPLDRFGLVLSGEVEVAQEDAAGNRHIIGRILPGELYGETLACAGGMHSPVTVTAVSPSEILDIDYSRLASPCGKMCARHTSIIRNLLRILADKNLLLTRKMDVLTRKTIRARVASYLLAEMRRAGYFEFSIPFDRNGLAEYLACDRSALSRELSRLRGDGFLDYGKNRFSVLDAPALAEAASI